MRKAGENSKIESVLRRQKATTDADRAEEPTPTPTTQGWNRVLPSQRTKTKTLTKTKTITKRKRKT